MFSLNRKKLWYGGGVLVLGAMVLFAYVYNIRPYVSHDVQTGVTSDEGVAYMAGGCFWCTESDFEKLPGVLSVTSGYINGSGGAPTYATYGDAGFTEAVKIVYDTHVRTYEDLVWYLMDHVDVLDGSGQFVDRGHEYIPAVYYQTQQEKNIAQSVVHALDTSGSFSVPVAVPVEPFQNFFPAEDYHQDYYLKNALKYSYYRQRSGRDARVHEVCAMRQGKQVRQCNEPFAHAQTASWQTYVRPDASEVKKQLSDMVYHVTQEEGTEPAFQNAYNENHKEGIYVDVLSGEPLYSSTAKYDSGTGWPSFYEPISADAVETKTDWKLVIPRTEVHSRIAKSHLGHVFDDGPAPTGKRYCMNSAALRFVPRVDMEAQGYGSYLYLFNK